MKVLLAVLIKSYPKAKDCIHGHIGIRGPRAKRCPHCQVPLTTEVI